MSEPVQYQHWKGEHHERGTIVIKKKPNKMHIDEELEGALKNHIYTDVQFENGAMGKAYVAVDYEHSDYPKMLFHPDFHREPPPNRNHHKETYEWEMKFKEWRETYDRTQTVENPEDEQRLLAKGWLPTPPIIEVPKSHPNSEEI